MSAPKRSTSSRGRPLLLLLVGLCLTPVTARAVDDYELLKISRTAPELTTSLEAALAYLKINYRAQSKIYHPDVKGGGNEQRFKDVANAYDRLQKYYRVAFETPTATDPWATAAAAERTAPPPPTPPPTSSSSNEHRPPPREERILPLFTTMAEARDSKRASSFYLKELYAVRTQYSGLLEFDDLVLARPWIYNNHRYPNAERRGEWGKLTIGQVRGGTKSLIGDPYSNDVYFRAPNFLVDFYEITPVRGGEGTVPPGANYHFEYLGTSDRGDLRLEGRKASTKQKEYYRNELSDGTTFTANGSHHRLLADYGAAVIILTHLPDEGRSIIQIVEYADFKLWVKTNVVRPPYDLPEVVPEEIPATVYTSDDWEREYWGTRWDPNPRRRLWKCLSNILNFKPW